MLISSQGDQEADRPVELRPRGTRPPGSTHVGTVLLTDQLASGEGASVEAAVAYPGRDARRSSGSVILLPALACGPGSVEDVAVGRDGLPGRARRLGGFPPVRCRPA